MINWGKYESEENKSKINPKIPNCVRLARVGHIYYNTQCFEQAAIVKAHILLKILNKMSVNRLICTIFFHGSLMVSFNIFSNFLTSAG